MNNQHWSCHPRQQQKPPFPQTELSREVRCWRLIIRECDQTLQETPMAAASIISSKTRLEQWWCRGIEWDKAKQLTQWCGQRALTTSRGETKQTIWCCLPITWITSSVLTSSHRRIGGDDRLQLKVSALEPTSRSTQLVITRPFYNKKLQLQIAVSGNALGRSPSCFLKVKWTLKTV